MPTNRVVHYTLLFNAFIVMTLFNQLNSRKIGANDFNIFSNLSNSFYFVLIIAAEAGLQFVFVTFGGMIFRTTPLTLL
jgi:hypothetical protein